MVNTHDLPHVNSENTNCGGVTFKSENTRSTRRIEIYIQLVWAVWFGVTSCHMKAAVCIKWQQPLHQDAFLYPASSLFEQGTVLIMAWTNVWIQDVPWTTTQHLRAAYIEQFMLHACQGSSSLKGCPPLEVNLFSLSIPWEFLYTATTNSPATTILSCSW